METFTKTPGLQQISEDIFRNLDKKSLLNCRLVNQAWKGILDVPIFCLKNLISSQVVENWKYLSQQIEDEQIAKEFSLVLTKMEKSEPINPLEMVIELGNAGKYPDVMKFIIEHEKLYSTIWGMVDPMRFRKMTYIGKKVHPFCKTNIPCHCHWGMTPIHLAAWYVLTQSIERLKDKYDSPIDYIENSIGENPIHFAAFRGHLEIVKVLAKFADDPTALNVRNQTPITYAAIFPGKLKIVEFLTKFTDCPNAPDTCGNTPIHYASCSGDLEIVEFLSKFTDVLNPPNICGYTPIKMAKSRGYTQIVKFLEEHAITN